MARRRYLDSANAPGHLVRVAPANPFREGAPARTVVVRWKPQIASARGVESARYDQVVLVLRSATAIRLYAKAGLLAVLDTREIASITE